MNILNLKTGEPFDPLPRLHHKPETSLAVSSSELSARARGMLLAARMFVLSYKGDDMKVIKFSGDFKGYGTAYWTNALKDFDIKSSVLVRKTEYSGSEATYSLVFTVDSDGKARMGLRKDGTSIAAWNPSSQNGAVSAGDEFYVLPLVAN